MQLTKQKYVTKASCLFLVSILLQVLFLMSLRGAHKENESTDYAEFYAPVAENLLHGRGFRAPNDQFAAEFPPGYPIYLAAHFYIADHLGIAHSTLIKITNVLLMALGTVVLFLVGETIFGQRIAFISGFLWVTYPFSFWLAKQPNSEIPFIVLLYLALLLLLRGMTGQPVFSLFVAVGLLLGLAALIRPVALFLPLVFFAVILVGLDTPPSSRFRYAAVMVAAFVLAIAPWEAVLKARTGEFLPLSTNGPASMLDGLTFSTKIGKGGDRAWVPERVEVLGERVRENESSLRTTGAVVGFVLHQTRNDPVPMIELGLVKALRSWYGTNAMWHESPTAIIQTVYLSIVVAGIWLGWKELAAKRRLMLVLLAVVVYFWAMTMVVLSILRYMVPAMGILLMYAAVSLDALVAHWSRRRAAIRPAPAHTSV